MFPDDLIPRATQILLPRWSTADERSAWLAQAFFLAEPRLYNDLRVLDGGQPIIILTNTITALLEAGCLPNKKAHALAQLLTSVRILAPPDTQTEIDRLVGLLNNACAEDIAVSDLSSMKSATQVVKKMVDAVRQRPSNALQSYETPLAQRTPTVFISYSHADDSFALRLIDDLQDYGHAVWIDKMNIKGGAEWVRSIADGISNSYAFVSVLSPDANTSRWVQREYLYADNLGKPIFPVMARPSEVPFQMIDRQVLSLIEDYADGLQKLLDVLPAPRAIVISPEMAEIPAPKPSPAPPPQAPAAPPLNAAPDRAPRQQAEAPKAGGLLGQLFNTLFGRKRAEVAPPTLQPTPRPVLETEEDFRKAIGGLPGGAANPAPSPMMMDKRALELLYINRVTAQRIDAMVDMPDPSPDDRVRVMSMAQGGLTTDDSAWADIPYQTPDKGGVTALTTRRAMLIGDDRQDSMTALWAAAGALMHFATDDPAQPIPAVINLSGWANTTQSLEAFIRHELGELGAYLDALLRDKRIAFLFDGLDTLSPERKSQVEAFLTAHPDLISIVDLTPNTPPASV